MISIEPDWRAVGHIIARDCEHQREAIEQMAEVMSIVRYAQRAAEQGDEDANQLLKLLEIFKCVRDGKHSFLDDPEVAPVGYAG